MCLLVCVHLDCLRANTVDGCLPFKEYARLFDFAIRLIR